MLVCGITMPTSFIINKSLYHCITAGVCLQYRVEPLFNIQTTFIHYRASQYISASQLTAWYIMVHHSTSHHLQSISVPNEVTVPLDFQHIFPSLFQLNVWNIQGLNKTGVKADVASRRVETKMEERKSGVRVVRWPTLTFWRLPKAHGLPNMVFGLDLQTRQLPSLQDSRSALTFRSPNMVVLGGVSSTFMLQQIGKSPNPWTHHGKFHNPLLWFYVIGDILLQCSGVLFRSKY